MAFTTAASNNVVDLSENNDNAGTQATVSSVPLSNTTDSFERSCDNPECSAPRLICQVPKRTTSEFVTEPMIVHQPTLINGFTTVFQIDGIGTRIEDLMNDAENNTLGENFKPKTMFRVVPNTHAHIVNYVVVDAADETMRKIKDTDPETMRKLLVSQRLSADQMLKKLIGKALETPTRIENPSNAAAVDVVPGTINVSTPKVPPGITIKLLPASEANKSPSLATSTASANTSSRSQIAIKPVSEAKKSASASTSTVAKATPSSNKLPTLPTKSFSPKIQKSHLSPSLPTTAAKTNPRPTTTGGRVITATKPVVWQAVPPGTSSKCTSSPVNKTTPPRIAPTTSPRSTQPVLISPTMIPSSSLNTAASLQPKSLNMPHLLDDVEKSISATSITVNRSLIDSPSIKPLNVLKRKPDLSTPVPEAIKRLRPRSPTRVQNTTPLAGNVSKTKDSPQATRKLPTLSKFQKAPAPQKVIPLRKGFLIPRPQIKPIDDQAVELSDVTLNKKDTPAIEGEKTNESNPPTELDTPSPRKSKPLMGPASKMKALKAIADAKAKALQSEAGSQCKPALITECSPMKIGATIITRTGSMKGSKESIETAETVTKPCSVTITDIAKSNAAIDSDSDSIPKRPRVTLRSSSENEPCNTTDKKSKASEDFENKFQGRWTIKNEDGTPVRKSFGRATRSSAMPKATLRTPLNPEGSNSSAEVISDSTLLTTPSAPSRVLRVVLPSTKNGIVNNPATSPHPNLKISSVISGGTTLPASMREVETETAPIIINNESSGPDIEQLQKELAELRRTIARLTEEKNL